MPCGVQGRLTSHEWTGPQPVPIRPDGGDVFTSGLFSDILRSIVEDRSLGRSTPQEQTRDGPPLLQASEQREMRRGLQEGRVDRLFVSRNRVAVEGPESGQRDAGRRDRGGKPVD